MQEIIVILIVATAALAVVCHYYRQLTKKDCGCNCCPHTGGTCHCHEYTTDTHRPCCRQHTSPEDGHRGGM